jgi:3-methyladenine DNA glycosylase/8-oxoguanine DNA glycosylase
MLSHIDELLNAPTTGASAPSLEHLEDTLTDGYAQALALEGECWRLERQLAKVVRGVGGPEPDIASAAEEISTLTKRISRAEEELTSLRDRLGSLQDRSRSMRRARRVDLLQATLGPS